MSATASSAIVLFAHGARDPDWAWPFDAIRARITAYAPDVRVSLAFLELMTPSLDTAVEKLVADGVRRIDVVPVFMAQGGHVKHDVPLILDALRVQHPGVTIALTPAVGEAKAVIDAIADWVIAYTQHAAH